jgi:hypothetical protein
LIPKVYEDLIATPLAVGEDVVLVLMCGLNDWKTLITEFPYGSGPITFKKGLQRLLLDVKLRLGPNLHIFLPGMPIGCAASDPKAA